MKRTLTLSVLIIISVHCFSQCDSAFLRQAATAVYDVSLISDKIIVGVGFNGSIIKSVNGGNSWRNIPNGYGSFTLKAVAFTNNSTGYVTGDGGIMKTEDQGETWFPLLISAGPVYYDLHFFNKDSGIFVGRNGHVLSTTDGGRSFKDTIIGGSNFYTIDFIDDSTGLIGSKELFKTTDGGKIWKKVNIDNLGIDPTSTTIKKIHFITPAFAALCTNNNLFATSHDGGETWTQETPDYNVYTINDFYFFDEQNGIATGDASYGSLFLHTADGGQTFTVNTNDPQDNSVISLKAAPLKNKLIAVGGSGINAGSNARNILISTDKGNTWAEQSNNREVSYYHVQFINDSTGFISGADAAMYETEDYGESWIRKAAPVSTLGNTARNFYFTDTLHGYGITENLSYTADGSKTWVVKNLPPGVLGDAPQFIIFFDSLKGTAYYRDSIYYTNDGAGSWQTSVIPPDNLLSRINSATRTPEGKLFTVGEYGRILQSADGGKTWSSQNISNETLLSIYFYDDKTGFIGTSNNIIYKTTDGGVTWNSINTNIGDIGFVSFAFSDEMHGFMLGSKGQNYLSGFYHTADGGNTWNAVQGASEIFYNLSGFNHIYTAGNDGVILKTGQAVKPSVPGYIQGQTQVCDSSMAIYTIAGNSNLAYTWSVTPTALQNAGSTADTIQWKGGGQFTIAVAASNICGTGTARTQIVNVINFKPEITVKDSVLSVTKGLAYTWYLDDTIIKAGTADSNALLVAHKSGIYKAEVTGLLGCSGITDTIDYAVYLPFRLISFTGLLSSAKQVTLQWEVANESSVIYEVIERGSDSVHFTAIDSLPARNNNNAGDVYTYTDAKPVAGMNFYRLRFTHADGTVSYSLVLTIPVNLSDKPLTYPNPATNVITINKGGEDISAVTIYNSQGVAVISESYSTAQTSITIHLNGLKYGLYYIKIKTAQNVYTQQLVIIR